MNSNLEPMVELFLFESRQMIEQLEEITMNAEGSEGGFSEEELQNLFRIAHTIKGSSGMMMIQNIANLTHSLEDIFCMLQKNPEVFTDYSEIYEVIFNSIDFISKELDKIANNQEADGDHSSIVSKISVLRALEEGESCENMKSQGEKQKEEPKEEHFYIPKAQSTGQERYFKAHIEFEENTEMINIRGFTIVNELESMSEQLTHYPENLLEEKAGEKIQQEGLHIFLSYQGEQEDLQEVLEKSLYVSQVTLEEITNPKEFYQHFDHKKNFQEQKGGKEEKPFSFGEAPQSSAKKETGDETVIKSNKMISVHTEKLDMLMNLVGELVVSETLVSENPDLEGLSINNFRKASRRHKKIINELQDISMSLRMIPLTGTFNKMKRIIRDMSRELDKKVDFHIRGEETEVDKNVVDSISDPLMHMIRNAADHGIEPERERLEKGKEGTGEIILSAKNVGSEVWIQIKDDGRGLDVEKIYQKALDKGLTDIPREDLSETEIFSFIFSPSFSTKDSVSEFSGRGVGMDVVHQNIDRVGGKTVVESEVDVGTTFIIKIPLTLAIIPGMTVSVGDGFYTVPIHEIGECFRPKAKDIIRDESENEVILIRGKSYPIIRIHERFSVPNSVTELHRGVLVMIEKEMNSYCIFVDALIGEHQVVVKGLPQYLNKVQGVAGCSLLGSGEISLILDTEILSRAEIL